MAEVIENGSTLMTENFSSNAKGNAALTLGIIGTALGALSTIGSGASLFGTAKSATTSSAIPSTAEETYIERDMANKYIDITKQYYEGKISEMQSLASAFQQLNQQDIDNSFNLYKYSRDNKDELNDKISTLTSKVDVMAAVRPYQDALINAKIDNVAQNANFNLFRRTCRMLEGQLILPDASTSGFLSYTNNYNQN